MKFPKAKIEKAALAEKDSSGRDQLSGVYYDKESDHFLATDGFMAARIPVEDATELDESAFVPLGKWKEYRKLKPGYVDVRDDNPELSKKFPKDFINSHFPDSPEHSIITLDAKRLYELAQAICQTQTREEKRFYETGFCVKLHLPRVNQPMLVLPTYGEGEGILMEIQDPPSYILRDALDHLTVALESGDEINKALREKLRRALCDRV